MIAVYRRLFVAGMQQAAQYRLQFMLYVLFSVIRPIIFLAAWAAVGIMELLWRLLSSAAIGLAAPLPPYPGERPVNAPVLGWRERAADRQSRRRNRGEAIGDVEDY